jgi:hypothetical protein
MSSGMVGMIQRNRGRLRGQQRIRVSLRSSQRIYRTRRAQELRHDCGDGLDAAVVIQCSRARISSQNIGMGSVWPVREDRHGRYPHAVTQASAADVPSSSSCRSCRGRRRRWPSIFPPYTESVRWVGSTLVTSWASGGLQPNEWVWPVFFFNSFILFLFSVLDFPN